jgi:hypothetical protein
MKKVNGRWALRDLLTVADRIYEYTEEDRQWVREQAAADKESLRTALESDPLVVYVCENGERNGVEYIG